MPQPALVPPTERPVAEDLSESHRTALAELVDATYRLNLAVATSTVAEERLRAVRTQLDELSAALEQDTRSRAIRGGFDAPRAAKRSGEPYRMCAYTPWGLPFHVVFEGESVRATLVANALHEGPPDSLHGGVGGYLMDCMLGILVQAGETRAVTARLEIDYRARTPLDEPIELVARVARREGRKTWCEGWIEHDGRRTLEAEGLFIEVDRSRRG